MGPKLPLWFGGVGVLVKISFMTQETGKNWEVGLDTQPSMGEYSDFQEFVTTGKVVIVLF